MDRREALRLMPACAVLPAMKADTKSRSWASVSARSTMLSEDKGGWSGFVLMLKRNDGVQFGIPVVSQINGYDNTMFASELLRVKGKQLGSVLDYNIQECLECECRLLGEQTLACGKHGNLIK